MRPFLAFALAIICLADAQKLCGPLNVLGGAAEITRVGNCLYTNQSKISEPECKAKLLKEWKPNGGRLKGK